MKIEMCLLYLRIRRFFDFSESSEGDWVEIYIEIDCGVGGRWGNGYLINIF